MTIEACDHENMLNPEHSLNLLNIVEEIRVFHDTLPPVVIIPDELCELFELMPRLCEAMAHYTIAQNGHGRLTHVH